MIDDHAPVAQRIEQVPSKHLVAGSSPAGRAQSLTCSDTRAVDGGLNAHKDDGYSATWLPQRGLPRLIRIPAVAMNVPDELWGTQDVRTVMASVVGT